ncbi:trypsin-like peptidase domain-containing protein [Botrimarina colliarenosi]|nr:trypsin-like peptidase domain-containing protein [Botrimarina colliarenosi]
MWSGSLLPRSLIFTPSPRNIEDLRSLESQFQKVADASIPAVVAIQQPNSSGHASGALVSSDGLIVSSFHVSHRLPWDGVAPIEHLKPGETTTVVLADGRECKARLLGADQTTDISLLKLVDGGPYPFLRISADSQLHLGDWVLKVGHPAGMQRNRPPVIRVGRVVVSEAEFFVSDCNVTGGDSGGPFIDLDGEIVGIPSALVADERNYGMSNYEWAQRKSGSPILSSAIPARHILSQWNQMLAGKVLPLKGDTSRQSRLLQKVDRILPSVNWMQGGSLEKAFSLASNDANGWVVRVLDSSGQQVSLGTICSSDGKVVTVNGTLPDSPRCQLSSGETFDCDIVRRDDQFKLAVLKIPLESTTAASWGTSSRNATVGAFVAAPLFTNSSNQIRLNVGIVSTPELAPMSGRTCESFEVDMRLPDKSFGGPVVNLDCEAIGIAVHSTVYGALVIPAAQIRDLLVDSPR